jgi:hypothetical protein
MSKSIEEFESLSEAIKALEDGIDIISADDGETVLSRYDILDWFDNGDSDTWLED